MNIHFEPVTDENRKEILTLTVLKEQKGFIETVQECLTEAKHRSCWRPVGIYDQNLLIGFAMYGFFWEYLPFGRLWLDRFLIDAHYQGRGYGKAAFAGLLKRLDEEYHRKKIYLSVTPGNIAAFTLYSGFGFFVTGELDEHGEEVMVCSRSRAKSCFPPHRSLHTGFSK